LDVCNKPALVVSPADNKVLPLNRGVRVNPTDFMKLLYVLKYANGLNFCHRDVKPNNIFKDQNGRIILSDWSSVATTGVTEPWAGTSWFCEEHRINYSPRPADDLVELVRSVYLMNTRGELDDNIERCILWRETLQMARVCD
jgi:serine/threonine protein kinase